MCVCVCVYVCVCVGGECERSVKIWTQTAGPLTGCHTANQARAHVRNLTSVLEEQVPLQALEHLDVQQDFTQNMVQLFRIWRLNRT